MARRGSHVTRLPGARRRTVAAANSVMLALLGACAGTAGAPPAPAMNLLLPGASQLSTTHLRDATSVCRYLQRRSGDSTEHEVGDMRTEIHATSYDGSPALLIVSSLIGKGLAYRDTTLVRRAELAPVWEVSRFNDRRTRYDYDGRRVRINVTAPDSAQRRMTHRYDIRVFATSQLAVLLASVPLETGYQTVVPLYSEGSDDLEMDTVRVGRRDRAGVWDVEFADPVVIDHYHIDEATRTRLGYSIARRDGKATVRCVPDES